MAVQGGRITTNVAMLPHALRTNRPTRSESTIAAEVIEQLYAEVCAARRAGFVMPRKPDEATLRAEPEDEVPRPVERGALDASVAELEALNVRADPEPPSPSEGESLALVLHELKRLRAGVTHDGATVSRAELEQLRVESLPGDPSTQPNRWAQAVLRLLASRLQTASSIGPDPAVVTQEDLEALRYVEDMVRSSGFDDKADRLLLLHGVLLRVAQGREASHYRDSYHRALQRLAVMRQFIPEGSLRAFEVEWRTRKRDPLGDAAALNLPEQLRGELRQMADHCGAVSYSPPPMRAVRGVSLTFGQLEAFAVLVSGAVWPVPGLQ